MLARYSQLKCSKFSLFSQQLFSLDITILLRFISSFPSHEYTFNLSFTAESQVTQQMCNINQYGTPFVITPFLRIPYWLVLLLCTPLCTQNITPVETKRHFALPQAAWAHTHTLPCQQSAK